MEIHKALWRKVIQCKTKSDETDLCPLECNLPQGRGYWKEIHKESELVFSNSKIKIGNGKTVKFWLDIWKGITPLCKKK